MVDLTLLVQRAMWKIFPTNQHRHLVSSVTGALGQPAISLGRCVTTELVRSLTERLACTSSYMRWILLS